ncbi:MULTISPECIES: glycosyltransferase [unclassified Curtobacterium]|uniref:glycosyltransferase n=1 Tax=unclassified Curtobacterium TaxID=257496 RepID=UPI0021D9884E|nr:glycosyltransferase [Curtobacterium sp. RIT-PI-V]
MTGLPVVAFITHSAQLSGAELFVLRVTAAAERIRPLVVLGERGPLEGALAAKGVDVAVVPLGASVRAHTGRTSSGPAALVRKGSAVLGVATRLAALLRRRQVSVVTTHSAKAHLYGGVAGRLVGLPVVAHLHAVLGSGDAGPRNTALLRGALRVLSTSAVANSRVTADSARLGGRTVHVVGCPVTIPDTVPAPPDGPVFTVVGRLSPSKGQDLVIKAFASIVQEYTLPGARLRLVGSALFDRDDAHEARLRELVHELEIAERVDFVGQVDDVAAEFARCDVAVHASVVEEGFGQVVVEAMAAGRPVIASSAGGPAEIVTDEVDGLLVRPGSIDALIAAMRRTVLDPAFRHSLGDAGRRRAAGFTLDGIVHRLESILLDARR